MQDSLYIETIVQEVLKQLLGQENTAGLISTGTNGIFDTIDEAVQSAKKAQQELMRMRIEKREEIISSMRQTSCEHAEELAELAVKETGMGRIKDKAMKNRLAAQKTPGTEVLQATAITGDGGLTLVEMGPYGVIGSITPTTNPVATVVHNSISMVAAGNGVVFSVHPAAKDTSIRTINLLNQAITLAGGPANLITAVSKPSIENTRKMMSHPDIKMIVATGGPEIVKTVLSSGKKAIGAGAGNPPVIVDETANVEAAAKHIVDGASFDNNLPCIAEKEVIVVSCVASHLIACMKEHGAYLATTDQVQALMELVLTKKPENQAEGCTANPKAVYGGINKGYVGKDAAYIMQKIGVKVPDSTRLIICEVEEDHPFVLEELMMPILPIVSVPNIKKAIEVGVKVEHGNRHSAMMHSNHIERLTAFAKAVETTIFVKNGPSFAGIGLGGEGYTTFTIAGPTGEGLTNARSFTRQRRCVVVDGFNIV